jgi:hypothetical protein
MPKRLGERDLLEVVKNDIILDGYVLGVLLMLKNKSQTCNL